MKTNMEKNLCLQSWWTLTKLQFLFFIRFIFRCIKYYYQSRVAISLRFIYFMNSFTKILHMYFVKERSLSQHLYYTISSVRGRKSERAFILSAMSRSTRGRNTKPSNIQNHFKKLVAHGITSDNRAEF